MFIPPEVIIASSIGLNLSIFISNFFRISTSFCLSFLVISLTFLSGFIPDNSMITGIIFLGNSLSKLFLNSLFFSSLKSLKILSSNFSVVKAGFKSIDNTIFPFFIRLSTSLYLSKCAELLNIVGPDTPKCVNSISPKSSYITLFLVVSFSTMLTFFKLNPCKSLHIFRLLSLLAVRGTSDGRILVIVCPSFFAIS